MIRKIDASAKLFNNKFYSDFIYETKDLLEDAIRNAIQKGEVFVKIPLGKHETITNERVLMEMLLKQFEFDSLDFDVVELPYSSNDFDILGNPYGTKYISIL